MKLPVRIKPQILKGFRDYPPEQMAARLAMMRTAQQVFESFGFAPLETPIIEYAEVLLGKYGDEGEKQFYRFGDHGGRDVCLRFDLTVPLARYVAMNRDLPRPFKRYQIGTVFRGEHPKKGRFREFVQCDVDVVGTKSLTADAECIAVGTTLLERVGVPDHVIRVNHRGILNALFHTVGVDDMGQVTRTFRTLDKLEKVGEEEVRRALKDEVGLSDAATDRVFGLLAIRGPHDEVMARLGDFFAGDEKLLAGASALDELLSHLRAFGVPQQRVEVDLSIARGIDYYTGVVYETVLAGRADFGSIMGGGRYDHLIEQMAGEEIPAVGISMGLDRLVAALAEMGKLSGTGNPSRALVIAFGRAGFAGAQAIACGLRAEGINAEVSHEIQKVGAQFKYADRKGIPFVLTVGEDERARRVVKLKDMKAQSESEVTLDQAITLLRS